MDLNIMVNLERINLMEKDCLYNLNIIQIWENGKKSYEGDWVNGKKNGIGTMRVDDHYIYEGEYIDNLREGNGNI